MNASFLNLGRKTWSPPQFSMPHPIPEREVDDFIGEVRGAKWYRHRLGELREEPKLLSDRDILPDRVVVEIEVDGERAWRTFSVHAPGTFERLTATPVRGPKPPAPHRGIDALAMTFLGRSQPERIVAIRGPEAAIPNPLTRSAAAPNIKPAQPAARGAEAVIARLSKAGAILHLSTDRQHVILTSSGGRPGPGVVELFTAAEPLIRAYMLDGPLLCVAGPHGKGQDPTATTLLVGGCPSCDHHASEPITDGRHAVA